MSEKSKSELDQAAAMVKGETGLAKLAPEQETAIELLVTGKSMVETARGAGVSRSTLYRWMKEDAAFGAAYNQWRDQLREGCQSRLMVLTGKATVAVEKALDAGDARTGMQLLKGMGMIRDIPAGPTDAVEIEKRAEIEREARRISLRRDERKLEDDAAWAEMGV